MEDRSGLARTTLLGSEIRTENARGGAHHQQTSRLLEGPGATVPSPLTAATSKSPRTSPYVTTSSRGRLRRIQTSWETETIGLPKMPKRTHKKHEDDPNILGWRCVQQNRRGRMFAKCATSYHKPTQNKRPKPMEGSGFPTRLKKKIRSGGRGWPQARQRGRAR